MRSRVCAFDTNATFVEHWPGQSTYHLCSNPADSRSPSSLSVRNCDSHIRTRECCRRPIRHNDHFPIADIYTSLQTTMAINQSGYGRLTSGSRVTARLWLAGPEPRRYTSHR